MQEIYYKAKKFFRILLWSSPNYNYKGKPLEYLKHVFDYDGDHYKMTYAKSLTGDHPAILDYLAKAHGEDKAYEIFTDYQNALKDMSNNDSWAYRVTISLAFIGDGHKKNTTSFL